MVGFLPKSGKRTKTTVNLSPPWTSKDETRQKAIEALCELLSGIAGPGSFTNRKGCGRGVQAMPGDLEAQRRLLVSH